MNDSKYCPKCKDTKPISEFYKNKGRYDGLTGYCIICHNISSKETIARHPKMQSDVHKKGRWNRKMELFKVLGQSCCVYCEFAIYPALQFGHKNGNGHIDKIRFHNIDNFYKHYIEHPEEARAELEVTCANCNWIKRFKDNEHIKREMLVN